jgi:ABC-2 type transport system ATP-binding protein
MSELFSIKNLCVWYSSKHNVIHDFSIELKEHEIIGLIGLNGAGKTTFIKTLSGLLSSYNVTSAEWKGAPFSFRDIDFKLQRYTVFAEDHLFQYFTFREYLSYVAASYGKTVPDISALVQGFHFKDYTNVLLRELSTGNLKKAYLITAFALRPQLLLLDEPVNGLDFQSTEYLYQQINEYRKHGTILFSSHVLESICLTSDRVLVLEDGSIKHNFSGNEIEAEKIRKVLRYEENH